MRYVCPMHPEVTSNKPGKCPKCGGMELVSESELAPEKANYKPLVIILALILLSTVAVSYRDSLMGMYSWKQSVSYFMAGFFLVFSGFKLIDLAGFARGYADYDLLAARWKGYGYIYPFIELFFGLAMIVEYQTRLVLVMEFWVMIFSGLGVAIKLLKKEKFQCSCLGTALKIPLTKVTLVEDFGMAFLALVLLYV